MNQPIVLILLLAASLNGAVAEEKKIYKYTDENGVTHYTETKPSDDYEEADLPELSVVPSVTLKPPTMATSSSTTQTDATEVTEFTLLSPTEQQNLWGTGNKLMTKVTPLSEAQAARFQVQFVIDGQPKKPGNSSEQTFENIYRGEHTVQGRLIDRTTRDVVLKTKTVTFYMHQNSKK